MDSAIYFMNEQAISFGPFRLLAAQRLLLERDKPVRLGSRAFEILAALVERAGEVVGKEELIARAWPRMFVEEANLKMQVMALRRALGDGQGGQRYVVAVPGRGYNFVAPVRREEALLTVAAPPVPSTTPHNLPFAVTRMIGRDDAVAALVTRLSRERLVTIVGAGGIGKTTVALAVAERMMASYEHGIWLVDLAPIGDPRLVLSAVATVLGLEIRIEDPLHGLAAAVRDKRMLLLLDNCEHVIDAAASLVVAILSGARGVNILATSREPLGVAGEREHRLASLGIPQASSRPTAVEAAAFPAVQLFVERASAIVEDFALTDANAPAVSEICRRLDGLPLAIEFAASRVEVLGVEGLAARLDDSLQLLGARRRTTMPRYQTMRAVLDWSYSVLGEDEQRFFRALAIFSGGFTVEAAAAVAIDTATAHVDAIDRLAELVSKSLVVADVSGANPRFRLLDTTRAYAIEKLDASGDRERLARRHAEHYRDLFERAQTEWERRASSEWLADYAQEIDNLRAALDWAFSVGHDAPIGVALTASAVPLWIQLSLLEECRRRVRQALGAPAARGPRDPRDEMRLQVALGTSSAEASEMSAAFTKALEIANNLGDSEYQLRALRGLYMFNVVSSRFRTALPFAQRFYDLTARGSDPNDKLFGAQLIGSAEHYVGDHRSARHHLELALSSHLRSDHAANIIRFQTDVRVAARSFLARILWLQGFPDQARHDAEKSVEDARGSDALPLCFALALAACPIALWQGNLAGAERYAEMLLDHATEHNFPIWIRFGSNFKGVLAIKNGDLDAGLRLLRVGFDELSDRKSGFRFLTGLSDLVEALTHAGRIVEGLAVLEAGIEQSEVGWLTPELLRLKGELLLLQNAPSAAEAAKDLFRQALDEARRQEALSWELRAATSLAHLLRNQDRPADAGACLQPIYERFTEGFDTADLIAAKQLLDELRDAGRR